jgi:hypothetical protein
VHVFMCVNFVYILIHVHAFICVTLFFYNSVGFRVFFNSVELITQNMKIKEKNACNTFTTSFTMHTYRISNFE